MSGIFYKEHLSYHERRICLKNRYGLTGRGVSVAVLDTGITPHIDFDNRILVFLDLIFGHAQPYDDNGHGSHVAGLIGGSGRASKGRYEGMAPECGFVILKILDHRGNGRKQDVLKAIDWAGNEKEIQYPDLNISVGTTEQEKVLHDLLIEAVEQAWDDGLVVVTAAGNLGPGSGTVTAPGSSRKVITVGSSDLLTGADGISGCGPTRDCVCKPDLVAPGKDIVSCARESAAGNMPGRAEPPCPRLRFPGPSPLRCRKRLISQMCRLK